MELYSSYFHAVCHINYVILAESVQDASRENSHHAYAKFVESAWESNRHCTLRGQMELVKLATPINIDEVEQAANIVKRFCTGK